MIAATARKAIENEKPSQLAKNEDLTFERKLSDQSHAVSERFQCRISPAGGDKGRGLLVHRLVGFGEEAQMLSLRRYCKFFYSNRERNVAAVLMLDHYEVMQLSQLLCGVSLCVLPILHERLLRG